MATSEHARLFAQLRRLSDLITLGIDILPEYVEGRLRGEILYPSPPRDHFFPEEYLIAVYKKVCGAAEHEVFYRAFAESVVRLVPLSAEAAWRDPVLTARLMTLIRGAKIHEARDRVEHLSTEWRVLQHYKDPEGVGHVFYTLANFVLMAHAALQERELGTAQRYFWSDVLEHGDIGLIGTALAGASSLVQQDRTTWLLFLQKFLERSRVYPAHAGNHGLTLLAVYDAVYADITNLLRDLAVLSDATLRRQGAIMIEQALQDSSTYRPLLEALKGTDIT